MNSHTISPSGKIKCPFCAEEIQKEAIKCKHCGSKVGHAPSSGTSKRAVLFVMVWIAAFLCVLFSILTVTIIADHFLLGRSGDNAFNMPAAYTVLTVCCIVAQKVAKKHVRKDTNISFVGWLEPDLGDPMVRRRAAWFSAVVSGIGALMNLLQLLFHPDLYGANYFVTVAAMIVFAISSYFTSQMSRAAAITGLGLYCFEVLGALVALVNFSSNPNQAVINQINTSSWLVRILFLILLVNGVRATLAENPPRTFIKVPSSGQ